jgi:Cu(I)/Ag(I) efflux system membrane fusion protein
MKTSSIQCSIAAIAIGLFSACSGNKQESHDAHHHDDDQTAAESPAREASKPQFQVDEKFQQQLGDFFTAYVALKDAFVSSDADQVKTEAKASSAALEKVDMKLLSGAAHNDWMVYLSPMQSSLKGIEASGDIEAQRQSFSTLSDNLYKSIKAFGLGGKEAYYEFCPMAFNNKGGYWLSDEEKIRNPYFGDKMLTCGNVEEKLQ